MFVSVKAAERWWTDEKDRGAEHHVNEKDGPLTSVQFGNFKKYWRDIENTGVC